MNRNRGFGAASGRPVMAVLTVSGDGVDPVISLDRRSCPTAASGVALPTEVRGRHVTTGFVAERRIRGIVAALAGSGGRLAVRERHPVTGEGSRRYEVAEVAVLAG